MVDTGIEEGRLKTDNNDLGQRERKT